MVRQRESEAGIAEKLSLDIPAEPSFLFTARMFAAAIARHFGCGEDAVEDLKIAISEAVTNALKAHRDGSVAEPIRLLAHPSGSEIWFEVVDAGKGFDLASEPAPTDLQTPPLGLYEGSLGLTLIRSLFPRAEIVRNAVRGMTVRFPVDIAAGGD